MPSPVAQAKLQRCSPSVKSSSKRIELARPTGPAVALANAMEDLDARKADTVDVVHENETLEVDVSNFKETSEVFANAHAEEKLQTT